VKLPRLAVDPSNPNHIFIGDDGGFYLFDLTNGSFTALNFSISAGQIFVHASGWLLSINIRRLLGMRAADINRRRD